MRSPKDQLPKTRLERDFPYQVALPTPQAISRDDRLIQMFCEHRNVAPRHHTVRRGDKDFVVYCFADPQHAASFRAAFDGVSFPVTQ
jgi:hypothetical protein